MEIILTVLITLGVCILMYTFVGVVRLNKKIDELEELKMEVIDVEMKFQRMMEDMERDLNTTASSMEKDYIDRSDSWVKSTDRRFDYLRNDVKKLDNIVNPNMDIMNK